MVEKEGRPRANLDWNDEDVLPAVLSRDTEFVFRRMTEETLKAAQTHASQRVLDVGCGRGIDALALARRGGILFGCEPSRVMLRKAMEGAKASGRVFRLVSSLAEDLPFAHRAFQRVFCKGAIDHFLDPDQAVAEMCRVASPEGKVVISVANFESLSCLLARSLDRLVQTVSGRGIPPPHIWKIPRDHTYKFDYPTILGLAGKYLRVESIRGVSLLWGFPWWARILNRIPQPVVLILLRCLDKIASWCPNWGDVLIVVGRPRDQLSGDERSSYV